MSNFADLFGKAKYGGANRYRNHKLKQGDNFFRLGPPYKSLAAEGRWYWFVRQHFGYQGQDAKDPSKTIAKPFLCPLEIDRRTEMVKVPCAECAKIEENKSFVEQRIANLAAQGKSEAEIEKLVLPLKQWLKSHNVDKKYNVLAKNEQGEWGTLALPYKAFKAFQTRKDELLAQGIDPTGVEGVWLNFKRTGEKLQTDYTCDVVMEVEMMGNKRVMSLKLDTLTEADFESIVRDCPDLPTVGRALTGEQIEMLVMSNGDPEEVDRIFNMGTKREQSASARPAPPRARPEPAAPAAPPAPKATAPVVEENVSPTPEEDDELAALQRKMAEIQARKRTAALVSAAEKVQDLPTPKPPVVKTEVVADPKNLGDDEFLRLFGNK